VHNLLNWPAHLPLLLRKKAEGRIGHVGINTSEGRRHADFEQPMRTQPLDFVQFSCNPVPRGRSVPAAAGRRPRHRGARQPPVPAGRAHPQAAAPSAAAVDF
jgi:hypothetical protein